MVEEQSLLYKGPPESQYRHPSVGGRASSHVEQESVQYSNWRPSQLLGHSGPSRSQYGDPPERPQSQSGGGFGNGLPDESREPSYVEQDTDQYSNWPRPLSSQYSDPSGSQPLRDSLEQFHSDPPGSGDPSDMEQETEQYRNWPRSQPSHYRASSGQGLLRDSPNRLHRDPREWSPREPSYEEYIYRRDPPSVKYRDKPEYSLTESSQDAHTRSSRIRDTIYPP